MAFSERDPFVSVIYCFSLGNFLETKKKYLPACVEVFENPYTNTATRYDFIVSIRRIANVRRHFFSRIT